MTLQEANERLTTRAITEEELWHLNPLYILLDLHKDDFCRMVDAAGIDKVLQKGQHYKRLLQAEEELAAKERYVKAKQRLEELEEEKQIVMSIVNNYKPI